MRPRVARRTGDFVNGKTFQETEIAAAPQEIYNDLLSGVFRLLEDARQKSARTINSILTATYWEVGRRLVEFEQGGRTRAEYGESLLVQLAKDLSARHGRGFSPRNLRQMRTFYTGWEICPTLSGDLGARVRVTPEPEIWQTPSAKCPWRHAGERLRLEVSERPARQGNAATGDFEDKTGAGDAGGKEGRLTS